MKSKIFKRFAGILAFLIVATQITIPVYAIVDEIGVDDPVPTLYDESSDVPIPELIDATESEDVSAEEVPTEEVVQLSEDVDADNVTNVIETDVEEVSEQAGTELVDQAVEALLDDMEGDSEKQTVSAIEKIEDKINNRIADLTKQLEQIQTVAGGGYGKNSDLHMKLQKKIRHLHDLRNKFRAKAIKKNGALLDKIVNIKNVPAVYEIRWGDLTGKRQRCMGINLKNLRESLMEDKIPANCEPSPVKYSGKISVSKGSLTIRKEVLFEKGDRVMAKSGSYINFESGIAGHWDGLIVEYNPPTSDKNPKEPVNIIVSMGELNETYTGDQILGRKKIGNNHMIEFKHLGRILPAIAKNSQNKLVENKLKMEEKISALRLKLDRIHLMKEAGKGADDLEETVNEVGEYNFDDETATEIENEIAAIGNSLSVDSSPDEIAEKAKRLKAKFMTAKQKAIGLKFAQKLIPFKDTDDNEWFTHYVQAVKNRGIISGYKDAVGNELGEFRPGNNITIAEILKIGLETAGKGKSENVPTLKAALNHWAKAYVAKGEDLGLDIITNPVNLNRPATRGEVIRMMLEALGIAPDEITTTDFSDVPVTHKHARFIQYAKELGVISGDAGKTTFRPDAPINRAEAAKISDQINEIIIGGWDSVTQ